MRILVIIAAILLGSGMGTAARAQDAGAVSDAPGPGEPRLETEVFVSPLAPLDTTTPRATLAATQQLGRDLDAAYAAYRAAPSFALQREIRQALARVEGIFDLGATSAASRAETGAASFGFLKDILMRMPVIDPETLPGDAATAPDRTRLPGTEIDILRLADGPQAGSFVFSAETVARLPAFHARMIRMPILQPAPYESWREEQVRFSGPFVPGGLVRAVPEVLQGRLLGTPAWKVLLSMLVITGCGVLVARWDRVSAARAARATPIAALYWRLSLPIALGIVTLAARSYLFGQVNLSGEFFRLVQILTVGAWIAAAAWTARSAIIILGEHLNASRGLADRIYDRHLVRLISRVAGIIAAAAITLWGANKLGVPVLGLVAGMGVGGIALALAAQSTIENLFAGVSIFADRPFRVGDTIIYAGGEGTVESIGPRSTRIRALDGMQISVPNADLAKMQVTNKTCRDATLFRHVVALRYETSPGQVSDFCRQVMDLLETYPVDGLSEPPPRVRLVGLGDCELRVEVRAEFLAESEDEFFRLQEALLLSILEVVARQGLGLAYPTRTVLVGRDVPPRPEDHPQPEDAETVPA